MEKNISSSLLIMKDATHFNFYPKMCDFDFNLIQLKSSMYDIRNKSKRIWVETGDMNITSKFSKNIFKPDSNEGTIVAELNPQFLDTLQKFEDKVKNAFLNEFGGKPISGIMMTSDTVSQIFKSAQINNLFRISCDPKTFVVWNNDYSVTSLPRLWDCKFCR